MTPYARLLLDLTFAQTAIAMDWGKLMSESTTLSPEEAHKTREAIRVMQETLAQIAKRLEER
jgi:hypothetical protein